MTTKRIVQIIACAPIWFVLRQAGVLEHLLGFVIIAVTCAVLWFRAGLDIGSKQAMIELNERDKLKHGANARPGDEHAE